MDRIQEIWGEILRVTESGSSERLKALKTILFLRFTNNSRSSLNYLRFSFKLLFQLFRYKNVNFDSFPRYRHLFYLPSNTPANLNNLIPILLKIPSEEKGLILVSKSVNYLTLGSIGFKHLVYDDLISSIPLNKKLLCLPKSFRETSTIANSIKKSHILNRNLNSKIYLFLLYHIFLTLLAEIAVNRLLEKIKPKTIVSSSEYYPLDYLLINGAKKKEISTYIIQHGIIGINYFPFITDNMIVWGEYFKRDLLEYGADDSKIHVLGMPASDNIFLSREKTPGKIITSIEKVLILSDSQAKHIWPAEYGGFYNFLSEILQDNRNIRFFVRLHPAESVSFYDDLLVKNPNLSVLNRTNSLYDDIESCDMALTLWSTAGLEAMIYGIPLLVLSVTASVAEIAWWPSLGGGRYVNKSIEFNELITNFRKNPILIQEQVKKQSVFLESCFVNKGKAASEIAEFIKRQTSTTVHND